MEVFLFSSGKDVTCVHSLNAKFCRHAPIPLLSDRVRVLRFVYLPRQVPIWVLNNFLCQCSINFSYPTDSGRQVRGQQKMTKHLLTAAVMLPWSGSGSAWYCIMEYMNTGIAMGASLKLWPSGFHQVSKPHKRLIFSSLPPQVLCHLGLTMDHGS